MTFRFVMSGDARSAAQNCPSGLGDTDPHRAHARTMDVPRVFREGRPRDRRAR